MKTGGMKRRPCHKVSPAFCGKNSWSSGRCWFNCSHTPNHVGSVTVYDSACLASGLVVPYM